MITGLDAENAEAFSIKKGEPITYLSRLGQLVAVSTAFEVQLHVMGRFHQTPKICSSGGSTKAHNIIQVYYAIKVESYHKSWFRLV